MWTIYWPDDFVQKCFLKLLLDHKSLLLPVFGDLFLLFCCLFKGVNVDHLLTNQGENVDHLLTLKHICVCELQLDATYYLMKIVMILFDVAFPGLAAPASKGFSWLDFPVSSLHYECQPSFWCPVSVFECQALAFPVAWVQFECKTVAFLVAYERANENLTRLFTTHHGTSNDEHAHALGCSHVERKELLWIHIIRVGDIETSKCERPSCSGWIKFEKLNGRGPCMIESIATLKLTPICSM